MQIIGFFTLIIFCFIILIILVFCITIWKQNQHREILSTAYIGKINKNNEVKISTNFPYLRQEAHKLSPSKAHREFLKQTIKWDFLMIILCSKCFEDKYIFFANTWLFNDFELALFKKHGFNVEMKNLWGQLSAKCYTAILFWRLNKDLSGAMKYFSRERIFYKISWSPETAKHLYDFITNLDLSYRGKIFLHNENSYSHK